MFVDLFDSVGSIMACAYEAGMVDKNGKIKKVGKVLEADAVATIAGSLLGTSTTTTYVESASGIAAGARTGPCFPCYRNFIPCSNAIYPCYRSSTWICYGAGSYSCWSLYVQKC